MAIGMLLILLSGAQFAAAQPFSDWQCRMPLTVAAELDEPVAGQSLLVVLGEHLPGFAYDDFNSVSGYDLRFTDETGSDEIPYAVETWNHNGQSLIWLGPHTWTSGQQLIAYWHGETNQPVYTTNGTVWSAYQGVWHLAETNLISGTTGGLHADATGNRLSATQYYNQSGAGIGGGIGQYFNGSTAYIDIGNPTPVQISEDLTLSLWIKPESLTGERGLLSKWASSWCWTLNGGIQRLFFDVWRDAATSIATGQWSHVAAVYDATAQQTRLYVNGRLDAVHTQTSGAGSGGNLRIGHRGDGGPSLFQGWIDEARIAAVALPSNYLYNAWMNIASNNQFFSFGSVTSPVLRVSATHVSDRRTNAVTLHGYLQGTGGGARPEIYLCWDADGDRGTASTSEWSRVLWVGNDWSNGQSFSNTLTDAGLIAGQKYTARLYATNDVGAAWSSGSLEFSLGVISSVTNHGASWAHRRSASLHGKVTAPDAEPTLIRLHYWPESGGASNKIAVGFREAAFAAIVTNLSPDKAYTFQWSSSNAAGKAWSDVKTFTTLSAEPHDWYVGEAGDHTSGTNWTTAFNDLQSAIDVADAAGDRIHVLGGEYPLTDALVISGHPGLNILGGYEGTGSPGSTGATDTVITRCASLSANVYRRLLEATAATTTWQRVTFAGGRFNHSGGAIYLNGCNTILVDCTIRDQHWQNPYTSIFGGGLYVLGGRIEVVNGTFHNNVMYGGWWHEHGYGAGMAAHNAEVFISNTVFSANRMQQRGGSCRGGGLYLENGTAVIAQSVFTNNWFNPNHLQLNVFDGAGMYARNVRSLSVEDSLFSGNGGSIGINAYNWFGNAIYLDGALQTARVSRVQIINNRPPTGGAGNSSAIHMHGGTAVFFELTLTNNIGSGIMLRNQANFGLVNGLIARNLGNGISAQTGAVNLVHATISNNHDPNAATYGLHLINTPLVTGTNNIIYDNGTSLYRSEQVNLSDTRNVFLTYSCSFPFLEGNGNTERDPEFRDPDNGDFRIRPGSPALDGGLTLELVRHDLKGVSRPKDGNGNGIPTADMGAFERLHGETGALDVNFIAWPAEFMGAGTFLATFQVYAAGFNTNLVWFEWDFTGDGTPELVGSDLWTVTYPFSSGWHDVALTVRNGMSETATVVRTQYIRVVPDTVFVATNGLHRYPFHTPEHAATNIQIAMGNVGGGGTVRILPGEYLIAEQIPVTRAITLRGEEGWSNTTVRMTGTGRCFHLQHPDAVIDGLTLSGGNTYAGMNIRIDSGSLINSRVTANSSGYDLTGPLFMTGGVVSNCWIIGNQALHGGGIYLSGSALVTDSVIISNRAGVGWYTSGRGGGVYMQGGTMRNSRVVSNANWFSRQMVDHSGFGGGIYIDNGIIENVEVIGNDVSSRDSPLRLNGQGGGIFQAGGLIDRVTLAGNIVSNASGGGIRMTGGILRSALITGNNGGGINMSGGQAVNVTIARNWGGSFGGVTMSGGWITNGIVCYNATTNTHVDPNIAGNVTNAVYTCSPALTHNPEGSGNITNAPGFRDPGSGYGRELFGGDFRLLYDSPCIDTGINHVWMIDARGRDGNPRIIKGWLDQPIPAHLHSVDRGAYEFLPPVRGTVLFLY